MKIFVVVANIAVIVAMVLIYMNYVHTAETNRLIMKIQVERVVAQALINQ
jgi:hypothetical protein